MSFQPSLSDCLHSLEQHLRCMQRAGLKFDAVRDQSAQPFSASSPADRIGALRAETADCSACRLCSGRTHVVFGEGSPRARLMVVGGTPDSASDAQGRPFAGEGGELLNRILKAIDLQREGIYLTYAVKCLAAQEAGDDSIHACTPILRRQIDIIAPDIICALGPLAARALHMAAEDCSEPGRGEFFQLGTARVMPTHDPGLLLRRPELKRETWIDVQRIQRELETAPARNP